MRIQTTMEKKQSSSEYVGAVTSPDLPPTSSRTQSYEHVDVSGASASQEARHDSDAERRSPEYYTDTEMRASELRDEQVCEFDRAGTYRSEVDARETERRFSFRTEERSRHRREAEDHGEARMHRRFRREEYPYSSYRSRSYSSRVLSDRRRYRSESPRRRRHSEERRSREYHERRMRGLQQTSPSYLLRRRYSSLSFSISRGQSRPRALYRRTQWQPSRRAHYRTRSIQGEHRNTHIRGVPPTERTAHESNRRYGSDVYTDQESPRTLNGPSPMVPVNSQTERIIPEIPLVGYHLEDPRRDDYRAGFHRGTLRQDDKLVELRASTHDEHYNGQALNGSSNTTRRNPLQIHSSFPQPPVTGAQGGLHEAAYQADNHACFQQRHEVHPGQIPNGEFNFCSRCPRPVQPLGNFCPGPPNVEERLGNYYSMTLEIPLPSSEASQGGNPSFGLYGGGSHSVPHFQAMTWRDSSRMREPPEDGEQAWLQCHRILYNRINGGMLRTLRALNNEVDALRADMRETRSRIAKFVDSERKEQEKSLAFIADVKAWMAENT